MFRFISNLFSFFRYFYFVDLPAKIKNRHNWQGYGVLLFVGLPGYGKTMAMTEYALRVHKQYPDIPIYSNYGLSIETAPITKWQDIVDYPSGLFLIDEVQLTFSSRAWKDFPQEMLVQLTQNRKDRKQLLCTAQSFGFVDKTFRTLCNYVVECRTLGGRWTFLKYFCVEDYVLNAEKGDNGIRKRHRSKRYNFIQTPEIRDAYDTLLKLKSLKETEWQTDEEKANHKAVYDSGQSSTNVSVTIAAKSSKKFSRK